MLSPARGQIYLFRGTNMPAFLSPFGLGAFGAPCGGLVCFGGWWTVSSPSFTVKLGIGVLFDTGGYTLVDIDPLDGVVEFVW